jgi:hypothetical protein
MQWSGSLENVSEYDALNPGPEGTKIGGASEIMAGNLQSC